MKSATFGFRPVQSATDVNLIDESGCVKDDWISLVSRNLAVMANEDAADTPNHSNFVEVCGGLVSEGSHCRSDWDFHGRVQYCVCIKFLKSTIACMHVLVSEMAELSKERLS